MKESDTGDSQEAFVETYMEMQPFLHRLARSYAADREEEQDLFQDISTRLWEQYGTFRGDCQPRTWFYRVALNAAMEHRRRAERRPPTVALTYDLPPAADDPTQQMLDELYAIIRQLAPDERAIVALYLEDKNYEEIGAILHLSATNAGVKLHRIRQKMKTIKEHMHHENR